MFFLYGFSCNFWAATLLAMYTYGVEVKGFASSRLAHFTRVNRFKIYCRSVVGKYVPWFACLSLLLRKSFPYVSNTWTTKRRKIRSDPTTYCPFAHFLKYYHTPICSCFIIPTISLYSLFSSKTRFRFLKSVENYKIYSTFSKKKKFENFPSSNALFCFWKKNICDQKGKLTGNWFAHPEAPFVQRENVCIIHN